MNLLYEHISPYIPYGIYTAMPRLGKLEKYLIYGIKAARGNYEATVYLDDRQHGDYQTSYIKGINLILRPLSDIYNEIEVNGEMINPSEIFDIDYPNVNYPIYLDSEETRDYLYEFVNGYVEHHLDFMPYGMIQALISWRFDVFNLINNNLAISVHDARLNNNKDENNI